ncbi:hypothetical protein [Phocaeicola barnesiae]|jgi:hypothetical protein|uniref:hypothetical protein n=1 Tax=Phocaeicola barnesiae TaxID=376804 RepID=UPI0025A43751|nr:hypothetical protein [Phocaeicola barnesiae]MDM8309682.1 hypothetical protein [Phocaeicola barnesiae]
MADTNGHVKITDEQLAKSAVKYRKELLMMPVLAMAVSLQHMTQRPGVRGKEVVGELSGDIELGPYDEGREDTDGVSINPRTLETFLGSVVKKFSPNSVWQTVYGNLISKGEALKNVDITRQVLAFLTAKLGANLNAVLWSAVRNAEGTKSKDLFNGFDTITKTEKDASKISASLGNMFVIEAISKDNAVDVLKTFYRAADPVLREAQTKLFIPQGVYDNYVDDYQATVGHVPYNTGFEKTVLEGSNGRCELVPLANKAGSPFLHLTTKSNMLVGYGNGADNENITVEKHHAFKLDFVATTYFGAEFETISKERLLVGTIDGTTPVVAGIGG